MGTRDVKNTFLAQEKNTTTCLNEKIKKINVFKNLRARRIEKQKNQDNWPG